MRSHRTICIALIALSFAEARVTFPFSEVLQSEDLMNPGWEYGFDGNCKAAFKCDHGCKVYVDLSSDDLSIVENGETLVNFTDIVGADATVPDGYELPASKTYQIYWPQGKYKLYDGPEFVAYVVSVKSPNYGAVVLTVQNGTLPIRDDRFYTVLSSGAEAVQYYDFGGHFWSGYPRIYNTGYDAIDSDVYGRTGCLPVYQASSQSNAEHSAPIILAPITTIDFGRDGGAHNASANAIDALELSYIHAAGASTVYMSPGFVGCRFDVAQNYYSRTLDKGSDAVSDYSMTVAYSLDVNAMYYNLTLSDKVTLRVNLDVLDFYNNDTTTRQFAKHYLGGAFTVYADWLRRPNSTASWSMQLDYGGGQPVVPTTSEPSTTATAITAATVVSSEGSSSTLRCTSTTTSPRLTSDAQGTSGIIFAFIVVLAFA